MMFSTYRFGTGVRANPVGGQGVLKLITQHVIGTNTSIRHVVLRRVLRSIKFDIQILKIPRHHMMYFLLDIILSYSKYLQVQQS